MTTESAFIASADAVLASLGAAIDAALASEETEADNGTDFKILKRVLYTCEQAGYGQIRLAVGDARKVNADAAEAAAAAAKE